MPKIPKGNKGTLGRCLINNIKKKQYNPNTRQLEEARFVHRDNNEEIEKQKEIANLASVIDQKNLDDFLMTAELAEKKFDAERGIKIAKDDQGREIIFDPKYGTEDRGTDYDIKKNKLLENLRIPRKPKWDKTTTKQELHRAENESFLSWRRGLAQIEKEHYTVHITPYERNPEVWKQLWRVVERSDILVQIVDGRDPLFYRCEDLERYVTEVDSTKQNFLLINKSDLMSEEIRKIWNKYFLEKDIKHMFFSAKLEQQHIDEQPDDIVHNKILYDFDAEQNKDNQKQEDFVDSYKIANRANLIYSLEKLIKSQQNIKKQKIQQNLNQEESKEDTKDNKESMDQLLQQLDDEFDSDLEDEALPEQKKKPQQQQKQQQQKVNRNPNLVTIGMVGYPNVGKSSVINALCNKKLVGTGNMPGKTKSFQTVYIEENVMLCDCPGLVFPNAGSTRAEMVCNGVLPIDRLVDYLAPIDLMVQRIPIVVFEQLYTIDIGMCDISASTLLCVYAKRKGYLRRQGEADEAKSSKYILKNFINGVLIYCKLPPTYDEEKEGKVWQSNDLNTLKQKKVGKEETTNGQYAITLDEKIYNTEQEKLEQQIFEDEINANIDIFFDENDLIDLMDGKRVQNIKLNKQQKRDIKFAYNRGEKLDFKKYLQKEQIKDYTNKFSVKNKNPKFL